MVFPVEDAASPKGCVEEAVAPTLLVEFALAPLVPLEDDPELVLPENPLEE